MRQRVTTAVILGLIFIPALIFGNHFYIFFGLCGLLATLGAYEFRKMLSSKKKVPRIIDIATIIFTLLTYALLYFALLGIVQLAIVMLYLALILIFYFTMFVLEKGLDTSDVGHALLTIIYIASGFVALAYLRHVGLYITIYVLLVAILTDTFAYIFGVRFGKKRLCESISPKKSVEGAIAGLLFGGVLSGLFAVLMGLFEMHFLLVFLLSFFLSIVGQIGDLVASKFKRNHNIKDFSNLFPGHGGVMDRFDSWIFVGLNLLIIIKILSIGFSIMVL